MFKGNHIDNNQVTRILVAGAGDDLGSQFQYIAKAKAVKYQDQFPNEQIVLITKEETDLGDDTVILKNFGFNLIKKSKATFDGSSFIDEVSKFTAIASIDIFSHSTAQYGVHLDGKAHRLTLNTKGIEKLKGHFTKDAFVFLHGCNAGFKLAPYLSEQWEIPVAGAMTSTNFQKLHSDGNFYLADPGFAPNTEWATTNTLSFNKEIECKDGGCLRLKPDNHPYVGFWGEYNEGGLPFYKFFCVKNSVEDCKRVMAKSMLSFVTTLHLETNSKFEDYKKAVIDFICPISAHDLRRVCEQSLDAAILTQDETYNPFSRPLVQCDFIKCDIEIKCKKVLFIGGAQPGSCDLSNNFEGKATTLVREYKSYLDAYKYLNL